MAQHTLLNLTLTGVAAVAGFALTNDRLIFLFVPPLCFILGALYLDHTRCVERAGDYIIENLKKGACGLTGIQSTWDWEKAVDEEQKTMLGRLIWTGPFFLLFIMSGVIALIFSYDRVFSFAGWWLRVAWVIDVILVVVLGYLWMKITPMRKRQAA